MTYLAQIAIPYYTGNADDVIVNTFHFEWGGGSPPVGSDYLALQTDIRNFYQAAYTGIAGTGLAFVPWVNLLNVRTTIYDLDDTPPRVPVYDNYAAITSTPTANSSMPLEAAMVVSYRANYASGIPRARQRGRIYLGGFSANGMTAGTSSVFPQFSANQLATVGSAAANFRTAALADDWIWVVYSRAGNQSYPIVAGWVDAEIDTQRRRGNVLTGTRDPW